MLETLVRKVRVLSLLRTKRNLCCVLVVVSCVFTASAQKQGQALIDSLTAILPNLPDDTTKVNVLNNLAFNYRYSNDTLALQYGPECLALAQKIGWERG